MKLDKVFAIIFAAVSLLALWLIAVDRLNWLFSFQYPTSTDGFFYLQEFKERLEGRSYYSPYSAFFTFAGVIGRLSNVNPPQLFNLIFILGLSSFSLGIIIFAKEAKAVWLSPALVAMLWGSDILFFRHYAFLKQGFSLGVLVLGLSLIYPYVLKRRIKFQSREIAGVALIIFASLCHVFAAGLVLLFFIVTSNLSKIKAAPFLILLIFAGSLLAFLILQPKFYFRNPFITWHFAWYAACEFANCSPKEWFEFEIGSAYVLALLLLGIFFRSFKPLFWALLVAVLILNAPFWTEEGHMSYRLAFSSFWVLVLIILTGPMEALNIQNKASFSLLLVFLILSVGMGRRFETKPYQGNNALINELSSNADKLKKWLPEDAVVIAEHGMQFRISYFLDRKSIQRFPGTGKIPSYFQLKKSFSNSNCSELEHIHTGQVINCVLLGSGWRIEHISND